MSSPPFSLSTVSVNAARTPEPAAEPPPLGEIEELALRLDAAGARTAELDPLARQVLDERLDALNALHKSGLTAIVRALRADPRGKELLFELVDDPVVRMVLSMHGIIRSVDPMTVAERVLDGIRPAIRSHGGDVELVRIEDGVAYVRLAGACNGCSMAGVTVRDGVEKALLEGVPSLSRVEVAADEPAAEPLPRLTIAGADRPSGAGSGWVRTLSADRVAAGELAAVSLQRASGEAVEVIVVNAAGRLSAYVNACAHQGLALDNAIVDATAGTLTCPWHGFCYDATSGECLTMPGARLQQLPLRVADGHVWVRASG